MQVERPTALSLPVSRLKEQQQIIQEPSPQEQQHVVEADCDFKKLSENVQNSTSPSSRQENGREGQLDPNLQPSSPSSFNVDKSSKTSANSSAATFLANKYLLVDQVEGSSLAKCVNTHSQQEFVCKVIGREAGHVLLASHYRVDSHPHINSLHEVLLGEQFLYLVFPPSHGDLHSHVRLRKRIREAEARRLFLQMSQAVQACHEEGIVLRDLKLRKFVFVDQQRSKVKLESLEDAVVLEDYEDDIIQDKRGCPAYVSPEILRSHARYSGRAADMWSLGVILYTMLVGRYPFNDSEHVSLFVKISRGHFIIPDCVSSRAKCLIRSLLRREPSERLSAKDVLLHPWLTKEERFDSSQRTLDQMVPDFEDKS